MLDEDKTRFAQEITATAEIFGKTLSKPTMKIIFDDLSEYTLDDVLLSLNKCRKTLKFFPTTAEIIEKIPKSSAIIHPGADEAWSICLQSFDEHNTVIMTKQIAEARGIALDLYDFGDKTAARMAFRDAYNRLITNATKPEWFISEGFDKTLKSAAIEKAVSLGRLTSSKQQHFIEHHPEVVIEKPSDRIKSLTHISGIKKLLENPTIWWMQRGK